MQCAHRRRGALGRGMCKQSQWQAERTAGLVRAKADGMHLTELWYVQQGRSQLATRAPQLYSDKHGRAQHSTPRLTTWAYVGDPELTALLSDLAQCSSNCSSAGQPAASHK